MKTAHNAIRCQPGEHECKLTEYYILQTTWREPHCGQPSP